MKQAGGCACGRVRYVIDGTPVFAHACHCVDCQRTTGSAFLINIFVAKRDLQVVGETKANTLPTGNGSGRDLYFCPDCGTCLWTRYHKVPEGIVLVRGGTLDDTGSVKPQAHLFTKSKPPWVRLPDDVPVFAEGYDRSEVWTPDSLKKLREATSGT